jgi:cell division cycle protein 20 (cofactor of APC complex)
MTRAMVDGMAFLRRSVSVASFQSPPPVPKMPETSAHHHFRYAKVTIDFSLPADSPVGMLPMSWSAHNIVVFARGNRVHYKSLTTSANEDIGQLCRIQDTRGDLRAIECGGVDQPNAVAFGTSKGYVQIWDIATKKMTSSWGAKGVTAMKWNGPVLTVGLEKGTLRHFDTRIKETPKMKEQARKFTRHQCGISSLAWNPEGKLLASGDHSGMIYCWDPRQNVPLDVGEMVQRRKKMQHAGIITVSFGHNLPVAALH